MRIVSLCSFEATGGAAIAALRLNRELRLQGHEVLEMVRTRQSDRAEVISHPLRRSQLGAALRLSAENLPLRLARGRGNPTPWTLAWLSSGLDRAVNALQPDIVHVHWIGGGLVGLHELARIEAPIVWTLHDLWPLTGGCHLPGDCNRFEIGCGACPQLGSRHRADLSRWGWYRKRSLYSRKRVHFTAPTRWAAARCGATNPLLQGRPVAVVPNALDTAVFRPVDSLQSRRLLGLPEDKRVIAVGAVGVAIDRNKGLDLFCAAMALLPVTLRHACCVVVFGTQRRPPDLPQDLQVISIGTVHDERAMPLVYSAADVTVVPSREETFGYTAAESAACGTPVAYFASSGLSEVMEDGVTGLAAAAFDPSNLAAAVVRLLGGEVSRTGGIRMSMVSRFGGGRVSAHFVAEYSRARAAVGAAAR